MMSIFVIVLIILFSSSSYSQIKQRSVSTSVYIGIGYKFVFLTNKDARDAYPFFQLSNGDFLKEIDGVFGVTIDEKYGIEFSPAYLFTNSLSSDGFYFNDSFFVPAQTRLFALPINIRFKYYPFAENYGSSVSKIYFGVGGGPIYINEEITNQIYDNENRLIYYRARTSETDFWTSNFELMAGIGSFSKIGYGFELSYRVVPLKQSRAKPLVTEIVNNFSSINFSANIIFSF